MQASAFIDLNRGQDAAQRLAERVRSQGDRKGHWLIRNRGRDTTRRVTGRRPAAPLHEKSHALASRCSGPGPPSGNQRHPSFRVGAPLACALLQGRHLLPSAGSLPISYQPMPQGIAPTCSSPHGTVCRMEQDAQHADAERCWLDSRSAWGDGLPRPCRPPMYTGIRPCAMFISSTILTLFWKIVNDTV